MLNILKKTPLFKGKNTDEIKKILAGTNYTVERYKKGEQIFRIDQSANRIGILLKGHVVVEKNLACGKVTPVFLKYPGQIFGEAAVFSRADTYPCNVISLCDSEVLLFSKKIMLNMISRDTTILSNFLLLYADKILELNIRTELLSYNSISQKISFSLIYELNKYYRGTTVILPFSKKFWAESLDVSRPSLYRVLRDMESAGIIRLSGKSITILNKNKLSHILSE